MSFALLVADPMASTLALLALLWVAAKIGGELAVRFKVPAVAGQLCIGVLLAALPKYFPSFPKVADSPEASAMAYIGVVFLMFVVGLESSISQMLKVGWASLRVATMGVVAPMVCGLLVAYWLLPESTLAEDLFIGACLSVTSLSISIQVLRERGVSKSQSGKVIIGAAIIDDILGLLVLAAVTGIAIASTATAATNGGSALSAQLGKALGMTMLFLIFALAVGRWVSPRIFKIASRFRSEELLLPLALAFAFAMAYLGNLVGLATIVGACAAGLVLEHTHLVFLQERETHSLDDMLHPLVMTFAPLFFVLTGASIDVSALLQPSTLALAGVLTVAGIVGKYACGYVAGGGLNAPVIGWGMVPRGEVGIIFVAAGRDIKIGDTSFLSPEIQAGILGAILLTTILGPIGLAWAVNKGKGTIK
ncbi:MAG: cation:proton antiporter [Holophagaceae bacterium]|nr:cation:proton antiporter [Holophagaceae bacterium]